MTRRGEVRIKLDEADFTLLVEGGELVKMVELQSVRIVLADIGYDRMVELIVEAAAARES